MRGVRRAIVHIGHPKTATTFLQHLMLLNRQALADVGFQVPADYEAAGYWNYEQLAHMGRVFGGSAEPLFFALDRGQALEQFDPCFSNITENVLLSSELFFYYPAFVHQLARYLNNHGFAVHVIAYVGPYESMAVKAYCQNIRNHEYHGTLVEFLAKGAGKFSLRYHRIREALAIIPEVRDIEFRAFAPQFLRNRKIEDDFFSFVSEDLHPETFVKPSDAINISLTLPELEAVRLLNKIGNSGAVAKVLARERCVDDVERARIKNYYLSEQARHYIVEHISEDRERFAASMPIEQRSFWQFDSNDLPIVRLDFHEVKEVLEFALS